MRFFAQDSQKNHNTVRRDWRTPLTSEKDKAFRYGVDLIEPLHYMFGVALNEAISLRNRGSLNTAREQIRISIDLCLRVVTPLSTLLLTLERHSRHFGTLPSVEPLDVENFQGEGAKFRARMNSTLSLVLWSQQNVYIHKVRALEELVSDQAELFAAAAQRVAEGSSVSPQLDWNTMDAVHYDLTTAVCEAKILLKSFLVAVPEIEVRHFHHQITATAMPPPVEPDRRAVEFRRQ
jgi:hypothetical protein